MRKREEDEIRAAKNYFNRFKHKNIARVTKNNEKFEPEKLTAAMLEKHNEMMTQSVLKDPDSKISPGPFVTRIRKVPNDAISSPEVGRKPINQHVIKSNNNKDMTSSGDNTKPKRSASAENKKLQSAVGSSSEERLPSVRQNSRPAQASGASRRDGSESGRMSESGRSHVTATNSIEWDVETGLLPLLSDNPAYRDWETNDTSLKYLEERVRKETMYTHM